MKFFVTVWRIIVNAWKHLTRNVWLSLTTVFVLTLSLLSVNVLLGVNVILGQAVHTLEDKIDVSVYFAQGTPQGVLDEAKFFMASLPQVQSADLLTADDALNAFKQRHAQDSKILGALNEVDGNPLGATLIIKAKNPSDYPFLLNALKNPQFDFAIESKNFDDHADTIARVRSISQSVRFFGMVLVAVFAMFSVLIVFNTIRIAIYTQREEIGVMRLVGASSAFVRWPFVLEGVFLAVLGLGISAGIVFFVVTYLDPHLRPLFDGQDPGLQSYFFVNVAQLATTEGGLLATLIALSSWAAVGKYLRR
jgi:cell division transport system permease protein